MAFSRQGITLVELITSMTIIAILAGVVILSMSQVNRLTADIEARKLWMDLTMARQFAVSRRATYGVHFNSSAKTYSIYLSPSQDPADLDVAGNLYKRNSLQSSITVSPADLFIIPPVGNATGPSVITLTLGTTTKSINVFNLSGFFRYNP
ncbi:MAG: GspH/FimT family pseudopilin [Deltaproteobacteria bacterium]